MQCMSNPPATPTHVKHFTPRREVRRTFTFCSLQPSAQRYIVEIRTRWLTLVGDESHNLDHLSEIRTRAAHTNAMIWSGKCRPAVHSPALARYVHTCRYSNPTAILRDAQSVWHNDSVRDK
jgi:hypothetical protein